MAGGRTQLPGMAILLVAGAAALFIGWLLAQPALLARSRRRRRARSAGWARSQPMNSAAAPATRRIAMPGNWVRPPAISSRVANFHPSLPIRIRRRKLQLHHHAVDPAPVLVA